MRWIALLRAVNLGGHNKVPMAELRKLLARAGFDDVRTYIASGNVLLDGPDDRAAIARELERLIEQAFRATTTAILRTPDELDHLLGSHPFGRDTSRSHVAFLAAEPAAGSVERLAEKGYGRDLVSVSGEHAYLRYASGVHRARLSGSRLEQLLGVPATLRNWRTVVALAERAHG